MSAEGWILLVGLRVLDLGLLAAWLVWFFHLRGPDDDDPPDDGGDGPGPEPGRDGPRGPGRPVPLAKRRIRDHGRGPSWRPRRRRRPVPAPLPARVRRPRSPVPAHRALSACPVLEPCHRTRSGFSCDPYPPHPGEGVGAAP